jgi:hypothetical protein
MSPRLVPGVGAFLVAACLAGASCQERPAPVEQTAADTSVVTAARGLRVGDEAPAFSLPGSDGKQYTLSGYKGRQAVVLAWFSKAFTEG